MCHSFVDTYQKWGKCHLLILFFTKCEAAGEQTLVVVYAETQVKIHVFVYFSLTSCPQLHRVFIRDSYSVFILPVSPIFTTQTDSENRFPLLPWAPLGPLSRDPFVVKDDGFRLARRTDEVGYHRHKPRCFVLRIESAYGSHDHVRGNDIIQWKFLAWATIYTRWLTWSLVSVISVGSCAWTERKVSTSLLEMELWSEVSSFRRIVSTVWKIQTENSSIILETSHQLSNITLLAEIVQKFWITVCCAREEKL